ncbi:MAG: hypothetical protein A3F17_03125 [Gammaproteobacteria bacterium RIFCSPHIGHO2_12_FULL_41_15]|nr:MAG: hypothetical protein A3F17_03125 [Gammaproteobacteria bacterium RIFCSPHIGHO2_12_FULL_41_15]
MNTPDNSMSLELESLVSTLSKLEGLKGAYLFGSFAANQQTQWSDIDLALLYQHSLRADDFWQIKKMLLSQMNRDLDLIDLQAVDNIFQHEIIATGHRLLTNDTSFCVDFEVDVIMYYIDFSFYRLPILADIQKRGYIHDR